ncbi:MAG: Rho termination factor N-terminal domain-containing protein, partial [Pseudonocardiaceae bacterium]
MVLADLRELAAQLGVSDTEGMRKGDLISAIKERQGQGSDRLRFGAEGADQLPLESATTDADDPFQAATAVPERPSTAPGDGQDAGTGERSDTTAEQVGDQTGQDSGDRSRNRRRRPGGGRGDGGRAEGDQNQGNQNQGNQNQGNQSNGPRDDDDEGGRRRGRRFRDRNRRNRGERGERGDRRDGGDVEIREDDVLLPVAGILDVLDNYAFVRTTGYLSGPNDVYVSLSLVRRYGLRRGDAITGAVRQPREGEQQRQKFNPLVRVDSINGLDVDAARSRPEFTKLTPLYPNERLRLETEQHMLTTRVIDLVMPIGKGQRALIVSPPKAGKTMILQSLANAITTNNPECHLMVVLVDERPEEVTDMQRSVKGEVIASTFDRPPSDHTSISELAIER